MGEPQQIRSLLPADLLPPTTRTLETPGCTTPETKTRPGLEQPEALLLDVPGRISRLVQLTRERGYREEPKACRCQVAREWNPRLNRMECPRCEAIRVALQRARDETPAEILRWKFGCPGFIRDAQNDSVIEYCLNWAIRNESGEDPGTFVVVGKVGRGKTVPVAALYNRIVFPPDLESSWVLDSLWLEEQTLFGSYFEMMDRHETDDMAKMMRRIKTVPRLVWDDIGSQPRNEVVDRVRQEIVHERMVRHMATVYTTNVWPSENCKILHPRTGSRLSGVGPILEVVGSDRRQSR